jgi:hypothetical protein
LVEKERTFRGKRPDWRSHLKRKIFSLLVDKGGLTFTELFKELKNLPKEVRPGSYETLSELLKELYEQGEVEQEPLYPHKWKATSEAAIFERAARLAYQRAIGEMDRAVYYDELNIMKEIVYDEWARPKPKAVKKESGIEKAQKIEERMNEDLKSLWMDYIRDIVHDAAKSEKKTVEEYLGVPESAFLERIKKTTPRFLRAWFETGVKVVYPLQGLLMACQIEQAKVKGKLSQKQIERLHTLLVARAMGTPILRVVSDVVKEALEG